MVRTLDIVFAFVFQLVFLDYQANLYSVFGAVLVIACNVLVIMNKWLRVEQNGDEQRQSLLGKLRSSIGKNRY